jgi:hypothetical protein
MVKGCKSMYRVNIFINSMFKSSYLRIMCTLLTGLFLLWQGASAGFRDTLSGSFPDTIHSYTPEFNRLLDRVIHLQHRADSLHRLTIEWRKTAEKMDDPVSRGRLQKKIMQAEDSVRSYQMLADKQWRSLSAQVPADSGYDPPHPYLVIDTVIKGITVYKYKLSDEFLERLAEIRNTADIQIKGPSLGKTAAEKQIPAENRASSGSKVPAGSQAGGGQDAGGQAAGGQDEGFRIFDRSPYGPGQPFEWNYTLPGGVFYRIQIGVFSQAVPADQFGGLWPVTTESVPVKELTRYFVGKFIRMDNARSALAKVKALGYSDAFIIGYYNGQRTSFSKLKALEK